MRLENMKQKMKKIILIVCVLLMLFDFIAPKYIYAGVDVLGMFKGVLNTGILATVIPQIPDMITALFDLLYKLVEKILIPLPDGVKFKYLDPYNNEGSEPTKSFNDLLDLQKKLKTGTGATVNDYKGRYYLSNNNTNYAQYPAIDVKDLDGQKFVVVKCLIAPTDIFKAKYPILDANYFDGQTGGAGLAKLKDIVISWYSTFRIIAIMGMLCALIYLGIRIMISATAQDKSKYKQMLVDWVVGLCLLFCLNYIMSFTMNFVDYIVDIIVPETEEYGVVTLEKGSDTKYALTNIIGLLRYHSEIEETDDGGEITDYGYRLIHVALYGAAVVLLITFLIMYIKRFFTLTFLTFIAPLVALTYPIDKARDGKAQAFEFWLREYVSNAVLPIIHIILYRVLILSVPDLIGEHPLYAICALAFFGPAKKLVDQMFGRRGQTVNPPSLTGAAIAGNAFGKISSGAGKFANTIGPSQKPGITSGGQSGGSSPDPSIPNAGGVFDSMPGSSGADPIELGNAASNASNATATATSTTDIADVTGGVLPSGEPPTGDDLLPTDAEAVAEGTAVAIGSGATGGMPEADTSGGAVETVEPAEGSFAGASATIGSDGSLNIRDSQGRTINAPNMSYDEASGHIVDNETGATFTLDEGGNMIQIDPATGEPLELDVSGDAGAVEIDAGPGGATVSVDEGSGTANIEEGAGAPTESDIPFAEPLLNHGNVNIDGVDYTPNLKNSDIRLATDGPSGRERFKGLLKQSIGLSADADGKAVRNKLGSLAYTAGVNGIGKAAKLLLIGVGGLAGATVGLAIGAGKSEGIEGMLQGVQNATITGAGVGGSFGSAAEGNIKQLGKKGKENVPLIRDYMSKDRNPTGRSMSDIEKSRAFMNDEKNYSLARKRVIAEQMKYNSEEWSGLSDRQRRSLVAEQTKEKLEQWDKYRISSGGSIGHDELERLDDIKIAKTRANREAIRRGDVSIPAEAQGEISSAADQSRAETRLAAQMAAEYTQSLAAYKSGSKVSAQDLFNKKKRTEQYESLSQNFEKAKQRNQANMTPEQRARDTSNPKRQAAVMMNDLAYLYGMDKIF